MDRDSGMNEDRLLYVVTLLSQAPRGLNMTIGECMMNLQ